MQYQIKTINNNHFDNYIYIYIFAIIKKNKKNKMNKLLKDKNAISCANEDLAKKTEVLIADVCLKIRENSGRLHPEDIHSGIKAVYYDLIELKEKCKKIGINLETKNFKYKWNK